jgi:hypothetical protein
MNVENTQVQMRKGILEFCILHIISRGEVYASDMLEGTDGLPASWWWRARCTPS